MTVFNVVSGLVLRFFQIFLGLVHVCFGGRGIFRVLRHVFVLFFNFLKTVFEGGFSRSVLKVSKRFYVVFFFFKRFWKVFTVSFY